MALNILFCMSIDLTFTSIQTFVIFKHIFCLLIFVSSERKNLAYATTYLTRNEYTSRDDKCWCYVLTLLVLSS